MKHEYNSSSKAKVCCDIILSIPSVSLVPFPLLNTKWSSPTTSSIFFSILLLSTFAVCEMRLNCAMVTAYCSFWFLLYGNHCNYSEIPGPLSSVVCVVDQLCHYSETIFSQQFEYIPRYNISCKLLIPHLVDSFSNVTLQNTRASFVQCLGFLVDWVDHRGPKFSVRVSDLLLYSLRVFDASVLKPMVFFPP